jgi:hypothetical protein
MRGAALKIGQMLSIQDETVLPPQVRCTGCYLRISCILWFKTWLLHS